eukprot:9396593-Pyramimonas_sp.AAC.1
MANMATAMAMENSCVRKMRVRIVKKAGIRHGNGPKGKFMPFGAEYDVASVGLTKKKGYTLLTLVG